MADSWKSDDIIFFWETSSASAQLIDQYLTALDNMGFLARVSVMIVGDMRSQKNGLNNWPSADPIEAIKNATADYGFPIVHCPTFGHSAIENPIIPIGARAFVDVDRKIATLDASPIKARQ